MKDASIDDFLDGGEHDGADEGECEVDSDDVTEHAITGEEGDAAANDGEPVTASDDGDDSTDSVEPAVSTYAWSPDEAVCADCGATVERRWRDGDRLVCAECKAW